MVSSSGTQHKTSASGGRQSAVNKKAEKREIAKRKILNATLNLIADEGLSSLSHRNIAKAAGVQLAMTTYYFQTFDNLLLSAFHLFLENLQPVLAELGENQKTLMRECVNRDGVLVEKEAYITGIGDLFEAYFDSALESRRRQLTIESQFMFAQFLPDVLAREVQQYTATLKKVAEQFCAPLSNHHLKTDGALLLAVVQYLEFSAVGSAPSDRREGREMVERLLRGFLRS